jgi:SHS2 domain-containing protein
MFEAYGKGLKELFENSAEAMFETICQLDKVKPTKKIEVKIQSDSVEDLLYYWLQHLIALVDIEEMFFSKFEIKEIKDNTLIADVFGEPITPEKGETLVKAVTNYKFSLEKIKQGYKATVSLDI